MVIEMADCPPTAVGRAAGAAPPNRFLPIHVEADFEQLAGDDELLAPERRVATQFFDDATQSIITSNKFKAELVIRADDNASVERAVRSWANGKHYPKADIEDTSLLEVMQVAGEPVEHFDLAQAVSGALENGLGGIEVKDFAVTDSR